MFRGRAERKVVEAGYDPARLPPGQYLTEKWPVLHAGSIPRYDLSTWDLVVEGEIENPIRLSWDELNALPRTSHTQDIHCVTRWSRLDNTFSGVPTRAIIEPARPRPEAKFVMCHCEHGFTTNLPLSDFLADDCILAYQWQGQELTPEHGWPLRGLVPRLYLWKSAKWIRGIELRATDAPGFWEQNGYHMHGDPWREERFSW